MSRILNMVGRAIVRMLGDSGGRQTAQIEVTKDELLDDVPRMQNYGFTGVPPAAGTDCVVVFLGGDRNEPVVVAMENQKFRLKGLAYGEVAIYDDLGNVIKLGRNQVEVTAVTKLVGTAPTVQVSATSSATISSGGSSMVLTPSAIALTSPVLTHNGKNIGATHAHSGVTTGAGNTGAPV